MLAGMTTTPRRLRALVQRPHRKVHFASLGAGEDAWLTLCDRLLPVEGTAARGGDWEAYVSTEQLDAGAMCRWCWAPLTLAGIAVAEARETWQLEQARRPAAIEGRP